MVFERHLLPNGVRVVSAPMAHAESVACFVMLAAGSRYETGPTRGIAHFVEHMLFKGTERRPTARALAREVDAMGGILNAATSKEYTYYYVRCGADLSGPAFDVLADMLSRSKLDPDEIEREKGVILEEINALNDTPRDYVDELFEELVYGDTPLGWRTTGLPETVSAATRETFLQYLGWYTPARTVVGVAGRVDDAVLARVEELFGHFVGQEPEAERRGQPAANGERVRLDSRGSDQANLCLGVRTYGLGHPDRYVLQLIATLLGGGMSSRLVEEIRERRGLAYSIFALSYDHTDAGSLYAQAGVDVDRVDQAIETIARELTRLSDEPVSQDELEVARNYTKGRFVLQLESPHGTINFGLRREVLQNRLAEPAEVLAELDAVTAEDVMRVARDVLRPERLRLALVGPYDDAARLERLLT